MSAGARLSAWLNDERRQHALVGVACSYLFATFVRVTLERFDRLESRGWVPADDVATVADLVKLEARLAAGEPDVDGEGTA